MKKLMTLVLCLILAMTAVSFAEAPITWSGTISVAGYMFGPVDESKDIVTPTVEKVLREKYGLDVDIEIVYVENANYGEIMNTRIAGGTAPDIFLSRSVENMTQYYEQGAIASWTPEFWQENAPHVYEFITTGGYQGRLAHAVDMFWEKSMIDGKMVTIGKLDEQNCMPGKTLIYRGDWLDALGVEEEDLPTTLDDFIDLLYRFAKEDPDGNGIDDTYGCSASVVQAIFGAFGSTPGFVSGTSLWSVVDGEVVRDDVLPQNKEALEILQQLYADGVLHPEFISGENKGGYWAVSQGFINGEFGASCHASIDHYRKPEVCNDNGGPVAVEYYAINGADSDFVYGPWPMGPEGHYGLSIGDAVSIGENAVYNSKLNDDPDKLAAIFQIMDIFATDDELMTLAAWGIEGETFEFDENGAPKMIVESADMNERGVQATRSLFGVEKAYSELSMEYAFYKSATILNRLNYFDLPQYDSHRTNAVSNSNNTPSLSKYKSELITYRDETWVSIIKGELPLDYYETYVEEYMAKGGQVLTDEANAWYQSK